MSKFLKILVNTFLVIAILIAAAILIPPLAGISTTIVDSTTMDTNLPLGSITYSTNVDVSDLKAGDEILKENDISTYAYIIRSGDEAAGKYQVVSAADPEGTGEEIFLRNSVPKVAVVVPYIGYLMFAMHHVEGIIILALIVILMIILFILSELWRPADDEDNEEDHEAVINAGLGGENENGIDTETVKAAMEANVKAVNEEPGREADAGAESAEPEEETRLSWAEKRARKKAEKRAAREAAAAAAAGQEAEPDEAARADEETGVESAELPEGIVAAFGDDPMSGAVPAFPGEPAAGSSSGDDGTLPIEEADALISEAEKSAMSPAEEILMGGAGTAAESAADEVSEAFRSEAEPVSEPDFIREEPAPFAGTEEPAAPAAYDLGAGEAVPGAEPEAPAMPEEPVPDNRFAPVRRPSLTEMLDQAKAAGDSPTIIQDDDTGVTVIDYSDFI